METQTDYKTDQAQSGNGSYSANLDRQTGLGKLEETLKRFRLGRFGNTTVVNDVMEDIAKYQQERKAIGTNGKVLHDFGLKLKYALRVTTPEAEMKTKEAEMNRLDALYRKIEGKLWTIRDQVQAQYEAEAENLDEILEGRKYAKSEIVRIQQERGILGEYYGHIKEGDTHEEAVKKLSQQSTENETGKKLEKYKGKTSAELRAENYQLEKMGLQRADDQKSLNIKAKQIRESVTALESARHELRYVMNRVLKLKYEGVEKHLTDGGSHVAVDLTGTLNDLSTVQSRVGRARKEYRNVHDQATRARNTMMEALDHVSDNSMTNGDGKVEIAQNQEKYRKAQDEMEAQFDSLDEEVDKIEAGFHELPL